MRRNIICALDTGDLEEAVLTVKRLAPFCGAFKIGHGLVLPFGLGVMDYLREAGAERIFLDLKFHDIPNTVAIAVREAAKKNVWMLTMHLSGGKAMLTAAVEEARAHGIGDGPLLMGVSVLTSLDQDDLTNSLGVNRAVEDHMVQLSRMGVDCGIDGVVCSVHEAAAIRRAIGHAVIVTPGIRASTGEAHDQARVGDGRAAMEAGANYMVIGRALSSTRDPEKTLRELGLDVEPAS